MVDDPEDDNEYRYQDGGACITCEMNKPEPDSLYCADCDTSDEDKDGPDEDAIYDRHKDGLLDA